MEIIRTVENLNKLQIIIASHINDITSLSLHGKIILFADDAVIFYSKSNIQSYSRKKV